MTTSLDRLARGKYLQLTTFRQDGTAVSTPVWLVQDGDSLLVITQAESGKATRLRRSSRVRLAPCDVRGNPTGPAVDGTAELLDAEGTATAATLIARRYGLLGRLFMWRGRRSPQVGIRVRPDA